MQKPVLSMLMLSMLCTSGVAWAEGTMKPGLWEMNIKSDAMKNISKIPQAQMQKMRDGHGYSANAGRRHGYQSVYFKRNGGARTTA